MVTFYAVLLYGVPAIVVLVTLYTGWLGLRFYIDEVIKAPPTNDEQA